MQASAIFPVTMDDMDAIVAIEQAAFSDPWPRASIAAEIGNKTAFNFIAAIPEADHNAIAFIFTRLFLDELHIFRLAVQKPFQRNGVAGLLLKSVLETTAPRARTAFLEVRASNTAAIRFYQKSGFTIVGKRTHYYPENREDALIMIQHLKEAT